MSENPKFIPTDGVSKKLKIVVIMLTVLIFLAFIDQGGHLPSLFWQIVKTPLDNVVLFFDIKISLATKFWRK